VATAKEQEPTVESETYDLSQWEFIDRVPTPDDVKTLLLTLPDWWGVKPVEFADYVQGLPSNKKVMVTQQLGEGRTRKVEQRREVITLYFSVAGRAQMLRAAQEKNGWLVDFEPEPKTPTDIPGYLKDGARIVYREYCEIWAPVPHDVEDSSSYSETARQHGKVTYVKLGRRPGTAWVPEKDGKQAAGSNPYEKVETSARGRALGAWGFGVLPGSGVASLEEMLGAPANREALAAEAHTDGGEVVGRGDGRPEVDRASVLEDLLTTITRIQQLTRRDDYATNAITAQWFKDKTGVDIIGERDPDSDEILVLEWDRVRKTGQLVLARDAFKSRLHTLQAEAEGM
jgi:hypothetical protein